MSRILLRNGTVIDYASKIEDKLDVLIENNKIKHIFKMSKLENVLVV